VPSSARRRTLYEATKMAGDRLVDDCARSGGDAVIVHPARVYGPGPLTDANVITRMIHLYLGGRWRLRLDDDGVLASYAHVDDVARGILLAAENGTRGARYPLGGENVSFPGLLDLVSELSGVRRRLAVVSPHAGICVARLVGLAAHLGVVPPLTPAWIRVSLEDRRVDSRPAETELGYRARPLRDGLAETIAWLRARSSSRAA